MKNFQKILFILLLSIIVCTPGIMLALQKPGPQKYINENRRPAPFPSLEKTPISELPKKLEAYVNDHLGLRNVLIANTLWLHEWILASPLRYALRGENFGLYSLSLLQNYKKTPKPAFLYQLRALFAGEQAYFTSRDIYYLAVFPPNKENLLAADIGKWAEKSTGNLILAHLLPLLQKADINFIDLAGAFAKLPDVQNYYNVKSDLFHWNQKGLLFANDLVAANLQDKFRDHSFREKDFYKLTETETGFYPYGKVSFPDLAFTGNKADFTYDKLDKDEKDTTKFKVHMTNKNGEGTIVIVQDSYFWSFGLKFMQGQTVGLLPLGLNFQDVYLYDHYDFNFEAMEKTAAMKPLAVLNEYCERGLAFTSQWNTHLKTILLGEKWLGNLRLLLDSHTDFSLLKTGKGLSLQFEGEEKMPRLVVENANAFLELPSVKTDDTGYFAMALAQKNSASIQPVLEYRSKGQAWRKILPTRSIPAQRNSELGYYQVFADPDADVELRLVFQPGQYSFMPMDFLKEVSVK